MFSSLFNRKPLNTERFSFTHFGRILNVTLRRRSNAKRLTMRVRDGELALTTPTDITVSDARDFIKKHFDWVDKQLKLEENALKALEPPDELDALENGEKASMKPNNGSPIDRQKAAPSIWYRGEITPVHLYREPSHHGKTVIHHQDNQIIIKMPGTSRGSLLRPSVLLEKWLKAEAKAAIRTSLDEVLPLIDEPPVPLSVRDQKTRWGSCSTTRRLSFNWRLIMAPPASLHYVVVHEAAHLIHHDHSSRFWGLVEEMMPDFSIHQHWLKKHQQALFTGIDRRLTHLKPITSMTANTPQHKTDPSSSW